MVREPANSKQNNKDKAHLHNLPLLLHRPGNGRLPAGVLLQLEQVVAAAPQLLTNHRIAVSCKTVMIIFASNTDGSLPIIMKGNKYVNAKKDKLYLASKYIWIKCMDELANVSLVHQGEQVK